MFRKKRTIIKGITLPKDFNARSIINNIAFSDDGRYAAVTKEGDLVINQIPDSGIIEFEGSTITYKKGTDGLNITSRGVYSRSNVRIGSISGGSVSVSGGNVKITGMRNSLDNEIDQFYDLTSNDLVSLIARNEDLSIALQDGIQARVKGLIGSEPTYSNKKLSVKNLKGVLTLPRDISNLELALETRNGSITGDIMHPGTVESRNGSIILNLYAPLIVEASSRNGSINAPGMISLDHGRYGPVNQEPQGKLKASTRNGSIIVNYKI